MIRESVNLSSLKCLINFLLISIITTNLQAETLNLTLRNSVRSVHGWQKVEWNPNEVAIVICDMWDSHHSITAVRRVNEFAPQLNEVINSLRKSGVTIIHSPSDCMPNYKNHDARKRALAIPVASDLPKEISSWCHRIPGEEKASYPIDQSDGGEDEDEFENQQWAERLKAEGRNPGTPWLSQTPVLKILEKDFVASEGDVVWNILRHNKIKHVILAGVHTNMCVLGRPFGLRQMVRYGMDTVLLRDGTDVMYNPKKWPYVSHFTGLDLVIRHIEENVCSTITTDQIIRGQPFSFTHDKRPHLVIVSSSERVLDWKSFARHFFDADFRVDYVESDTGKGMNDISNADCLLLADDIKTEKVNELIQAHVAAAKPVIGTGKVCILAKREVFGVVGGPNKKGTQKIEWAKGKAKHLLALGFKSNEWSVGGALDSLAIDEGVVPLFHGKTNSNGLVELLAWSFARTDSGRSCATLLTLLENKNDSYFQRFLFNSARWATGELISNQLPMDPDLRRSNEGWVVRGNFRTSRSLGSKHLDVRTLIRIPDPLPNIQRSFKWESVPGSVVYINGAELKESKPGHWLIPSKLLKSGDLNLVVVRVSKSDPFKSPPTIFSTKGSFVLATKHWQEKHSDDAIDPNFPIPPQFGAPTDLIQEWPQIK
jgi:nicotinamidase-related amidase